MTKSTEKKLSRRDAMKILAAATGAAALATIPDKWIKPGLEVGVLPAHAQTSSSLVAGASLETSDCNPTLTSTATPLPPPRTGVVLRYLITFTGAGSVSVPLTGTETTNAAGVATLLLTIAFAGGDSVTVTWTFENPADGTGSADQVFSHPGGC